MNVRIVYLLCFGVGLFVAIVLVYVYSVYVNNKDDKLKDMLRRVASVDDKQNSCCIVLKKSASPLLTACFVGFMTVCLLGALLFVNIGTAKYLLTVFVFLVLALSVLLVFADYFLSMLVVVDGLIYIRCMTTLFRPVVVLFDGSQMCERTGTEEISSLSARYMINIKINRKSFVIMNATNKMMIMQVFVNMRSITEAAN